jgi:two-component system cell cycle sensor histidine kinase/response regulator CckA
VHVALEAALRMSGHEIQHRARLQRDYTEVPLVAGDIARLSQVFLHLLVNAAQAIPEGAPQRHRLCVATRRADDGRVLVEVSDTGEGIEPGLLGRIFEPFFTTRDVGEGTGMGLAVCRGIVNSLGGDITVHSRVGHGSTFVVSLPASDGSIARGTHEPVRSRRSFARPPRVLVVDRDRHAASVAATVLGELHDVAVAGSGREALTVLRREHDIDVVVCRLAMPEMNGMELYETVGTLRRELRDRFVFVAGSADETAVPEAREFINHVGAPLLSSPIPHTALCEAVARVLRDAAAEVGTPTAGSDPAADARVSAAWPGPRPRGTRVPSP